MFEPSRDDVESVSSRKPATLRNERAAQRERPPAEIGERWSTESVVANLTLSFCVTLTLHCSSGRLPFLYREWLALLSKQPREL